MDGQGLGSSPLLPLQRVAKRDPSGLELPAVYLCLVMGIKSKQLLLNPLPSPAQPGHAPISLWPCPWLPIGPPHLNCPVRPHPHPSHIHLAPPMSLPFPCSCGPFPIHVFVAKSLHPRLVWPHPLLPCPCSHAPPSPAFVPMPCLSHSPVATPLLHALVATPSPPTLMWPHPPPSPIPLALPSQCPHGPPCWHAAHTASGRSCCPPPAAPSCC